MCRPEHGQRSDPRGGGARRAAGRLVSSAAILSVVGTTACHILWPYASSRTSAPDAATRDAVARDAADDAIAPRTDVASVDAHQDRGADGPCRFGPWSAPVALSSTNSATDDWAPAVSVDELTLVFASFRAGRPDDDLYYALRPTLDADFAAPTLLSSLSSPEPDKSPALASNGSELLFSSMRPGGRGQYDLWIAQGAVATGFAPPQPLPDVNSPASEWSPWLSADGLRLYFTSTRSGDFDAWVAVRSAPAAPFTQIAPLAAISSPHEERVIALAQDELELFFASNRPGGRGRIDIWVARRPDRQANFGAPQNVAELNTPFDDLPSDLSADGARLYLNHDTAVEGGRNADLAVATRSCVP